MDDRDRHHQKMLGHFTGLLCTLATVIEYVPTEARAEIGGRVCSSLEPLIASTLDALKPERAIVHEAAEEVCAMFLMQLWTITPRAAEVNTSGTPITIN